MSPFEMNKIAAAILLSGLVAMITGTVADALYRPVVPEKRGFSVAVEEAAPTEGGAPKEEVLDIPALMASANPAAGEEQFKKCVACHTPEKGGANKVGPNLWNVVNGPHAHQEGFSYSKAMAAKHDEKWDYAALFKFLKKPSAAVPGTKMAFAGVSKPEDRANLIAYLRSLSDSPHPLP